MVAAAVDGIPVKALLLDSGADTSLVARCVMKALRQAGKCVVTSPVAEIRLNPVGGRTVEVSRVATFKEFVLETSPGPVMLQNLACYVEKENFTVGLTVGRSIGYSTDRLLAEARSIKPERSSEFPSSKMRQCPRNFSECAGYRWRRDRSGG